MAKNFVQPGETITLTAPYDVTSGGGVLVGSLFAVSLVTALSGAQIEARRAGQWDMAKATGEAWTVGAKLYWDNSAKKLTTTSSGNTLVGAAAAAQASGDTIGRAQLTGQIV